MQPAVPGCNVVNKQTTVHLVSVQYVGQSPSVRSITCLPTALQVHAPLKACQHNKR
jgi:hypothetical protein